MSKDQETNFADLYAEKFRLLAEIRKMEKERSKNKGN